MIVHVNKENFEETIKNNKVVLLDFWAPWCGPCRMLGPVLEEVAAEHSDIVIGKINIDDEEELANTYKIQSIPTVMVFKDGKVTKTSLGLKDKAGIIALTK